MNSKCGHRERIFEKFQKSGIESFHNYEVMELLLTLIFPRIDTKKIAKELLKQFKTVNGILNSDLDLLQAVPGMGKKSANKIKFMKEFVNYSLKERQIRSSVIKNKSDVKEYLRVNLGFRKDEYMAGIYLSSSHEILGIEEIGEGTVNRCHVYPRKIFSRAFSYGAAAIIIAHNHPGGTLEPSKSDWKLTKEIYRVSKILDASLLDHIIITNEKTISMRELPHWPVN